MRRALVCAGVGTFAMFVTAGWGSSQNRDDRTQPERENVSVEANVLAIGIPGAGAVTEVGDFLRGSPLHDKAAFTVFVQPGQVLHAKRVLVASTSNFGAPLARPDDPEGSVLSIDPSSGPIHIPQDFASSGGQAVAFNGAVQIYAAQSPAFLNSLQEPQAVTAALPSVSLPLGISINNGNGRPWIANAPNGAKGYGTITVLDPQGYPLAGAPNQLAGGVFASNLTNRVPGSPGGLTTASVGTAIVTKAPDLTGRAVFLSVNADGSVTQVNVLKGVDPLVPPNIVTPVERIDRMLAESTRPEEVVRKGALFNWVPTRTAFIADPLANRIVKLDIADDGNIFTVTRLSELRSQAFHLPVDMAPATREVSHGSFASNTTLGGGSDLYVLNRGDNSVARISPDGTVVARRKIRVNHTDFRVNGIAVSSDAQTLYITATTPGAGGMLMSIASFGQSPVSLDLFAKAAEAGKSSDMTTLGTFLFSQQFTPQQGLGPLFNDQSCVGCHSSPTPGGMGLRSGQDVQFIGRTRHNGSFDDLEGHGGPVARVHSVAEFGVDCGLQPGIPSEANIVATRNAMTLRGTGLIDTIADGDILANMATEPTDVRGRPNYLPDGRIGKFGWKASVGSVVEFMAVAFRNEMGVTNPLAARDEVRGCSANRVDIDALPLQADAKFLNTIDPPDPAPSCASSQGAAIFKAIG